MGLLSLTRKDVAAMYTHTHTPDSDMDRCPDHIDNVYTLTASKNVLMEALDLETASKGVVDRSHGWEQLSHPSKAGLEQSHLGGLGSPFPSLYRDKMRQLAGVIDEIIDRTIEIWHREEEQGLGSNAYIMAYHWTATGTLEVSEIGATTPLCIGHVFHQSIAPFCSTTRMTLF